MFCIVLEKLLYTHCQKMSNVLSFYVTVCYISLLIIRFFIGVFYLIFDSKLFSCIHIHTER